MKWTNAQDAALMAVREWLDEEGSSEWNPVFRIFGYAGTGKTTLAREFARDIEGSVKFAAFTGKASLVLRKRGCHGASTIHSLIYRPKDKSEAHLKELQLERGTLVMPQEADRARELDSLIRAEEKNLKRPTFSLNLDSDVRGASLVVIDEVSMVGTQVGEDLLSFGAPVLVLGDTAQLPPVADGGYFTNAEPDVMLTEIHRQAAGSPIIMLATAVRSGRGLDYGRYSSDGHEDSLVVRYGDLKIEDLVEFDQVLCGRNKTRKAINRKFREHLGQQGHLPLPGDRLVCLRNNGDNGLLNGSLWDVLDCTVLSDDRVGLSIMDPEAESEVIVDTEAHRHYFEDREDEIQYWEKQDADEFDFGYALTVHKAQGSQWPRVCLIDESTCFRQDSNRWLYTGITRAEDSVTVIK